MSNSSVLDDVTLEELERDPYPVYAQLRHAEPVAFLPLLNQWMVTRWDDCELVGKDDQRFGPMAEAIHDFFGPSILTHDGDVHRWLRSAVDAPLRPKAVKTYIAESARKVSVDYIERLRPSGEADATQELLELISVRVIGDVLGLTDVDDATLQRWFQSLSAGMTNLGEDAELALACERTRTELDLYMQAAIERLTGAPDDCGLSHMIHSATPDGRPRTFDELIGTIRVIILGGFQEPGHGAAASLLGVLGAPDQLAAVLEEPATAIPAAVHEGLRWISPFGITERSARVETTIGGVTLREGDEIAVCLGSADRDGSRYEEPDRFDLRRPRLPHAAFGYGAHFCAGHFVSRQMEQVALGELFLRLPGLRLDPEKEPLVRGFNVRGVKSLPVVWDA
jgi:aromatic O-demethylase, cytochrome P450 subunit